MLEHKDYRNFTDHMLVEHTEVNDKTLGVIGYGSIGQEVIRIAKVLDMKILVYTRTPREHVEGVRFVSLPELLKESDYVSLHCPLTSETRHLIDEVHLSMMKPSAAIINTARGALIDEQALIAALQNKRIAKAALDVQEEEPMREDNHCTQCRMSLLHRIWDGVVWKPDSVFYSWCPQISKRIWKELLSTGLSEWLRGVVLLG